MEIRIVHCPDRRCSVRMAWNPVSPEERTVTRPGPFELVCMDADDGCTGLVCSMVSVATVRMKERLARVQDPRDWDWSG